MPTRLFAKTRSQRLAIRLTIIILSLAVLLLGAYMGLRIYHDWKVDQAMAKIHEALVAQATKDNLDPLLVESIIRNESGGDPLAVSVDNARGLMQLTPETEDLTRRRTGELGHIHAVEPNLRMGCHFLKYLLGRFDGDVVLSIAAYHMGQNKVARLRQQNPNLTSQQIVDRFAGKKTRAYVKTVLETYTELQSAPVL